MTHGKPAPKWTASDTLVITKIPANANKILDLFEHFKKYGRIQGIHSYGTTATIHYDSLESAKTAFESPEAYAGNRFVRYFYARKPDEADSKLSKAVNWVRVRSVLDEVSRDIASAYKDTVNLQSSMHRPQTPAVNGSISTDPNDALGGADNWADLLEGYQAQRDEQVQEAEALMAEREMADPARILEIDERLRTIQQQLTETSQSIAEIEAKIAELYPQ
jgi:hypothetical protein